MEFPPVKDQFQELSAIALYLPLNNTYFSHVIIIIIILNVCFKAILSHKAAIWSRFANLSAPKQRMLVNKGRTLWTIQRLLTSVNPA